MDAGQPWLEPATLHLAGGGSAVLAAWSGSAPAEVAEWSSSDPGVAAVDASGRVHAVGPGRAEVTAVVGDRLGGTWATAEVTVIEGLRGFVSFRTEHERYSVAIGGTVVVNLVGRRPDGTEELVDAERWGSREDVAVVDPAGVATGVGEGHTTLHAVLDGSAEVAVATLTVVRGALGFVEVRIEHDAYEVGVGATVQGRLVGTAPPSWDDTDPELPDLADRDDASLVPMVADSWSSSDESVATVDADGLVTGVAEGSATLYAGFNGHGGAVATSSVRVTPAG